MHRKAAAMQDPVTQVIGYSPQFTQTATLSSILILASQQ